MFIRSEDREGQRGEKRSSERAAPVKPSKTLCARQGRSMHHSTPPLKRTTLTSFRECSRTFGTFSNVPERSRTFQMFSNFWMFSNVLECSRTFWMFWNIPELTYFCCRDCSRMFSTVLDFSRSSIRDCSGCSRMKILSIALPARAELAPFLLSLPASSQTAPAGSSLISPSSHNSNLLRLTTLVVN